MKHLVKISTLSLLLLFSVDAFADEICFVTGKSSSDFGYNIGERCDAGDVLRITVDRDITEMELASVNNLGAMFCDFDSEIVINSDKYYYFLTCILEDNKKRKYKD